MHDTELSPQHQAGVHYFCAMRRLFGLSKERCQPCIHSPHMHVSQEEPPAQKEAPSLQEARTRKRARPCPTFVLALPRLHLALTSRHDERTAYRMPLGCRQQVSNLEAKIKKTDDEIKTFVAQGTARGVRCERMLIQRTSGQS